jgi:hypothetical protein
MKIVPCQQDLLAFSTLRPDDSPKLLLSQILANRTGTLRFGRALRQMERSRPGILRDVLDRLATVSTVEALLKILHTALEFCVVEKSRSKFIIVPNDNDAQQLLIDTERFGVKQVASVLIILSSLRYLAKYDKSDFSDEDKYGTD